MNESDIVASVAERKAWTLGAWILPISSRVNVAVGHYELKSIEYVRETVSLPGLPAFCEQGFVWRNQFIPALDLHSLVSRRRIPCVSGEKLAAIIAYENNSGEVLLAAIFLQGVPKLLHVMPAQSVAITELGNEWRHIALAAFRAGEGLYPVLDLHALFDKSPADLLTLH